MLVSIRLSVPVLNEKSIHSAAIHSLIFWSSPNNVWKNVGLYVITMTDSRIIMHLTSI
uniref:Macaca fascicularis brain cDNA clone: QflA-16867, similar to human tripartite motif-containing 9 (TRIM9), transcriptvariant 1, mRNA, RefSeq: NM_015163.4 n=1 Tax=Macaca fascicularis TaxID=9541 RepID=I7GBJ2_MACFA|nr:unnamed protein product [Macaca fascicularis]